MRIPLTKQEGIRVAPSGSASMVLEGRANREREISHSGFAIGQTIPKTVQQLAEMSTISQLAPAFKVGAKVLHYTANDLELAVSCPSDGWLLVTDRWASGWQARVNGRPVPVYGGDFIFRAIRVEAVENEFTSTIARDCTLH